MPITRRQFDLGIDNRIEGWMRKIHAFLAEHKDEAFNAAELKLELHPSARGLSSADLREKAPRDPDEMQRRREYLVSYEIEDKAMDLAMGKLAQVGAIDERLVSGTSYYLCRGPLVLDDAPDN